MFSQPGTRARSRLAKMKLAAPWNDSQTICPTRGANRSRRGRSSTRPGATRTRSRKRSPATCAKPTRDRTTPPLRPALQASWPGACKMPRTKRPGPCKRLRAWSPSVKFCLSAIALARSAALAAVLRDLRDPTKREHARKRLPSALAEARAAMDRLEQKLGGRVPADDLAQELADDEHAILAAASSKASEPDATTRAELARRQREIAAALRSLAVPDAELARDEAVQLAERARQTLAGTVPSRAALAAVEKAASAAQALADRLAGRQTERAQVAALGRAQKALSLPGAELDPVRAGEKQKAIASELKRLPVANKQGAIEQVERAAALTDRALAAERDQNAASRPGPESLADARAGRGRPRGACEGIARTRSRAAESRRRQWQASGSRARSGREARTCRSRARARASRAADSRASSDDHR